LDWSVAGHRNFTFDPVDSVPVHLEVP